MAQTSSHKHRPAQARRPRSWCRSLLFHLENPEERSRAPGVPFGLIIAPTQELVMQIAADAESLTQFTDLRVMAVVGGIDYEKQKQLTTPSGYRSSNTRPLA